MQNLLASIPLVLMVSGCLVSSAAASVLSPRPQRVTELGLAGEPAFSAMSSLNYIILLLWLGLVTGIYGTVPGAVLGLAALGVIFHEGVHQRLAALAGHFDRSMLARDSLVVASFLLTMVLAFFAAGSVLEA